MSLGGKQNSTVLGGHGIRETGIVFYLQNLNKTEERMVVRYLEGHGMGGGTAFVIIIVNLEINENNK